MTTCASNEHWACDPLDGELQDDEVDWLVDDTEIGESSVDYFSYVVRMGSGGHVEECVTSHREDVEQGEVMEDHVLIELCGTVVLSAVVLLGIWTVVYTLGCILFRSVGVHVHRIQ